MTPLEKDRIFFFISINEHFQQGHFQSWRELCVSALATKKTFFLDFKSFEVMVHDIENDYMKYHGQHLHLEWIHDLSQSQIIKFDLLANKYDFKWSSHMAISQALRNCEGSSKKTIKTLFDSLLTLKKLTAIWSWDTQFDRRIYGNFQILGVPDFQPLDLQPITCSLCDHGSGLGKKFKGAGLVGQLFGYRGVDLIVSMAQKQKDRNFLLLGKQYADTFKPKTRRFLNSKPSNLILIDEYFETDNELNHAINHLSCLIIDTRRYPEPSGIALRALGFGIPILIHDQDSYLKYLSPHFPGIHILRRGFFKYKYIDWKKVTQPSVPKYESRESALLKIQVVADLSLKAIL